MALTTTAQGKYIAASAWKVLANYRSSDKTKIIAVAIQTAKRDGARKIEDTHIKEALASMQSGKALTMPEMIKAAKDMPIQSTVYRCRVGSATFRLVRMSDDEWFCDVYDPSREVSNDDEKYYTSPSYARGFVSNRVKGSILIDNLVWLQEDRPY